MCPPSHGVAYLRPGREASGPPGAPGEGRGRPGEGVWNGCLRHRPVQGLWGVAPPRLSGGASAVGATAAIKTECNVAATAACNPWTLRLPEPFLLPFPLPCECPRPGLCVGGGGGFGRWDFVGNTSDQRSRLSWHLWQESPSSKQRRPKRDAVNMATGRRRMPPTSVPKCPHPCRT